MYVFGEGEYMKGYICGGVVGLLFCTGTMVWGESVAEKLKKKLRSAQEAVYTKIDPLPKIGATVELLTEKSKLCDDEVRFRRYRRPNCQKAQEKVLGKKLSEPLNIGVVCSGGGMRACLVTLGALMELSELGLLDTTLAVGGLSGSSWAIIPWYESGKPIAEFYKEHINRIVTGLLFKNPAAMVKDTVNFVKIITKIVARRATFWEKPTIIDPYSLLLWLSLVDEKMRGEYLSITMESLLPKIADGKLPAPVMTLVAPLQQYRYGWLDCWPWGIESVDLGFRLNPPSGLGSKFDAGKEIKRHYGQPLGLLLGAWGSAISVSLYEALAKTGGVMAVKLEPERMDQTLRTLGLPEVLSHARILPLIVYNPAYQLPSAPAAEMQKIEIVDAGVHYCLPFEPFEHDYRPFDVLIVIDAAGDLPAGFNLYQAEIHAKQMGRPFPAVGDTWQEAGKRPYTVYEGSGNVPTIVYFPTTVTNAVHPDYDPDFNPQKEIKPLHFMDTFNFIYTRTQAEKLAGFARHAVHEGFEAIKDAMRKRIDQKKGSR
jgi:hypothetical protein